MMPSQLSSRYYPWVAWHKPTVCVAYAQTPCGAARIVSEKAIHQPLLDPSKWPEQEPK